MAYSPHFIAANVPMECFLQVSILFECKCHFYSMILFQSYLCFQKQLLLIFCGSFSLGIVKLSKFYRKRFLVLYDENMYFVFTKKFSKQKQRYYHYRHQGPFTQKFPQYAQVLTWFSSFIPFLSTVLVCDAFNQDLQN